MKKKKKIFSFIIRVASSTSSSNNIRKKGVICVQTSVDPSQQKELYKRQHALRANAEYVVNLQQLRQN